MSGQKSSKLPSEYTVEELLEATTVEGDTKVDPSNPITSSEVYTFINIFKLAPGPYLVRTSLLYKLYKAWSKKPMKKMEFGIRFTEIISKNESESIHRLNRHSRELIELPIQYQARNNTAARFRTVFPRFQEYLNHYNIKQGTYFIECYVLYQLYIMFKPGKDKSRVRLPTEICKPSEFQSESCSIQKLISLILSTTIWVRTMKTKYFQLFAIKF